MRSSAIARIAMKDMSLHAKGASLVFLMLSLSTVSCSTEQRCLLSMLTRLQRQSLPMVFIPMSVCHVSALWPPIHLSIAWLSVSLCEVDLRLLRDRSMRKGIHEKCWRSQPLSFSSFEERKGASSTVGMVVSCLSTFPTDQSLFLFSISRFFGSKLPMRKTAGVI